MTVRDPADVDWTKVDDLQVTQMSVAGIPQARAEAIRRGIHYGDEPEPRPASPGRA